MNYRVLYPAEELHPGGKYYEDAFESEGKAKEFMSDVNGIIFAGKSKERK